MTNAARTTDDTLDGLGILHLEGSIDTDQQLGTAKFERRDDITGERERPATAVHVRCELTAYLPVETAAETLLAKLPEAVRDETLDEDMRLLLRMLEAGLRRRLAEYRKLETPEAEEKGDQ